MNKNRTIYTLSTSRTAIILLLATLLTATTAWADETLTFTFYRDVEDNSSASNSYIVYGGTDYKINGDEEQWNSASVTIGEVTITSDYGTNHRGKVVSMSPSMKAYEDGYRYSLNENYASTLSFTSSNKYISKVVLYCTEMGSNWTREVDNNTKSCSVNINETNVAYRVDVTLSDSKPLHYYDISYMPNEGTNDSRNPTQYEMSAGVASFYEATRTGYTFGGWFSNSGLTDAITSIPANSTGAKTLYAKWTINKYTISFDTNGGTTIDAITQDYDTDITVPTNPTRTGYNFAGWSPTLPAKMPAENRTHTAQWTPTVYAITYTLNDGTLAEANPNTYTIETGTFTLNNPTRTGYTFTGWTGSNGSTPETTVTIAQGSTGALNYMANWTINNYAIAYDLAGGALPGGESNPATYNMETNTFTLINPTRTGYTFTGWTGSNGSTPQTTVTIDQGSTTGALNYKANWTINQYTITFVTGEGGTVIDPITQDYDTDITAPADPTRPGYDFTGWSTTLPVKMPAENMTVTAQWVVITYNITYDLNGGTNHSDNPTTYTVESTITLKAPTLSGYYFAGWTGSNGSAPETTVTIAQGSTGDKSYTAHWLDAPDWATANSGDSWDDAYIIRTPAHLDLLATRVNSGVSEYADKYFKLGADLEYDRNDLAIDNDGNGTGDSNYKAIGICVFDDDNNTPIADYSFKGHFDGEGHTISGIVIYRGGNDDNNDLQGLFGQTSKAEIKNITLADAHITGRDYVGGIVGKAYEGTITNCHVARSVTIHTTGYGGKYHGGITGDNSGTLSHCSSAVTLTIADGIAPWYYGGITGDNAGTLSHNFAIGAIVPAVGMNLYGAIGVNEGSLYNNYYADCMIGSTSITNSSVGASTLDLNNFTGVMADASDNDGAVSATILSELSAVSSTLSGTVAFHREFKGGKASTVCLPFAYTPAASGEGTYYAFSGISKEGDQYVATMTATASTLAANTPYVFVPDGSESHKPVLFHGTADYDASKLAATSGDWTFRGTYERLTYGKAPFSGWVYGFASADKTVGDVAVKAGEFVKATSGAAVPPMRCYLTYKNGEKFNGARRMTRGMDEEENLPQSIIVRLVGTNGETTSVMTLDTRTGELTADGWYTLGGTRLAGKPSQRGVYINNGKKVIIK